MNVGRKQVEKLLGPVPFFHEMAGREPAVGVITGLAATAAGGEILLIEATRMSGCKNLMLTGQLGEVMKESAQAALSYLHSQADALKISAKLIDESDVHLHVPAGATPKEGPSAGIALTAVLISLFTNRVIDAQVAMTGEITLHGRVLPVGGIRDKVLAAQRAGIRTVVLPKQNGVDLEEVPATIRKQLNFVLVDHMDEVLRAVLGFKAKRPSTRPTRKRASAKARDRSPAARVTGAGLSRKAVR